MLSSFLIPDSRFLLPFFCFLLAGCQNFHMDKLVNVEQLTRPRVELPPPPAETILRAGHWEQESAPQPGTLAGDLASTKVLFNQGKYSEAGKMFHWLQGRAEREKNPEVYEECLFYEAECLYAQGEYPKARELYHKLLSADKGNPSSRFRNEAVQRQFDIADNWLEVTRQEMQEQKEYEEGRRWFVLPRLFQFEKEKPFLDAEGHALKACEAVYLQDPSGPKAPEALYRAGGVSFFRERYLDADNYYSTLVEQFPRSPQAPHALELAIQSKIHVTGGAEYDGRKLAEARQLVDTALRSYPELKSRQDFLERTLISINEQQAEKDFGIAEFYRRTKHAGPAYFQYELVRRRYAGTAWADKATERMMELRAEALNEE
jgi:tetratricopeptide (TPR) repeat protein